MWDASNAASRCIATFALVLAAALFVDSSRAASERSTASLSPGDFDLYVSPTGADSNPGTHWARPLRTIGRALELAQPGHRISIQSGQYYEDVRSVRAGRSDALISLVGSTGAVLKGAGSSRVVELRHSYLMLKNLVVDGKIARADGSAIYRDKLVYLQGRSKEVGITGIRLLNLHLRNAGGECVRMKYFAHHNELAFSTITGCGVDDFQGDGTSKNGEGIYIGTAPEQLNRNPTHELDESNSNWIHHNRIETRGNECVDIKEASRFNLVEYNSCTGQLDENAAGISARGNENIIRFNLVWGNRGAGIRFGGDTVSDGIHNHAYGNVLRDNAVAAFKLMAAPQRRICGNEISSKGAPVVRGTFAESVEPASPCR